MKALEQSIGSLKEIAVILGDKWTPELLRFFFNEETVGFCQLQDLTGGINPRTLSNRLDTLESNGIIEKQTSPTSTLCKYRMKQKGHDLVPVLMSMQTWNEKYSK